MRRARFPDRTQRGSGAQETSKTVTRRPPSEDRGWSVPMVILFLCFVLLTFQWFVRSRFQRVTGLSLPAVGLPLRYQEGSRTPSRYILYQTLPDAAEKTITQGSLWHHPWRNDTVAARFCPTGRRYGLLTLRGNALMMPDKDRWFLMEDDTVDDEGYLAGGNLVLVYPRRGRIYLLSYD